MKQIFTPWRMEYILSAKQDGCLFCDMIAMEDDPDSLIVRRGEHAFMVLNKYPYNNGHFMVVPYRHVEDLEALAPEEMADIMGSVTLGMRALRHCIRPEGFNVGVNIGKAAGAGVKNHVHVHVVPRWSGDANFMSVIADIKLIPQALRDTYDQLRAGLEVVLAGD
jgi:ATP adenylyltransferase